MAFFRQMAISFLVLVLLSVPVSAMTYTDEFSGEGDEVLVKKTDPAAMFVDVVAARPLGVVSIVGGTATFFVSFPFSLFGGNTKAAFNRLIADPVKYTFARPLGDF